MKKNTCIFLFFLFPFFSKAQITFNKIFSLNFYSLSLTSILPTDSCYYSTGVISDTIYPYNPSSVFVKFDLEGQPLIIKTLSNTTKTNETWDPNLKFTPDNNIMVAGYSSDTCYYPLVIKYNVQGNVLWRKEYNNSPPYAKGKIDVLNDFLIQPDSSLLLVGWKENDTNGNDLTCTVLKANKYGELEWRKVFGDIYNNRANSIIATPNQGNYVWFGYSNNHNKVKQGYIIRDYIVSIDAEGKKKWQYYSPSKNLQGGNGRGYILATSDGGLIIASTWGKEIPVASVNDIYFHGYIYKLDSLRNLVWGTHFRNKYDTNSYLSKLVALKNNSGYIAVGTGSNGSALLEGLLVKVSPQGDSLWTRRYQYLNEHESYNELYDVRETSDGGIIMCGEVVAIFPDSIKVTQRGWLLKTDSEGCLVPGCSVATIESGEEAKLLLYPNPVSDRLSVYLRTAEPLRCGRLQVLDLSGRVLQTHAIEHDDTTYILSVASFPSGTYLLQLLDEGKVLKTEKFVVVK